MKNDLNSVVQSGNFERAWRWINSSSDHRYKNYFRDLYQAYSFSKQENLKDLRNRVRNNTFQPSKPERVYIPKKSGILRPISLLPIEDQIVYQAFTNVVAEYHKKENRKNYNKIVYGNLYSTKSNSFFYRKWIDSYRLMNRNIIEAFHDGNKYIASFDITAFYDSIDHTILGNFLSGYGIDKEFIDRFLNYMSIWTADGSFIQGTGLPQGPLSSGLISEVVISYIDNKYKYKKFESGVKYFRYVDDIKLMANDEVNLRKSLVRLDYYSKRIGLLPQSSKINIHKIKDINEEIKNLSEPFAKVRKNDGKISPYNAEKELKKIIRKNELSDVTSFKIFLPYVKPKYTISKQLIELLYHQPFLYNEVSNYFRNYNRKVSDKVFLEILKYLEGPEVYQVINGRLLASVHNNISEKNQRMLVEFAKNRLQTEEIKDPYYRLTILSILLEDHYFKYDEIKEILNTEKSWWVLKALINSINKDFLGEPSYIELLNILLEDDSVDVALSAAREYILLDISSENSFTSSNYIAQKALKSVGVIKRSASTPSIIGEYLSLICKEKLPDMNWKRFFGPKQHTQAENKIARAYGYVQNDMSAFVNILDVFHDILLESLFEKDGSIGGYNLGRIGSVLNPNNKKFKNKYPTLWDLCKEVHEKRLECDISHPLHKNTGNYTKPIEYKYIFSLRKKMAKGYKEIIQNCR